MIKGNMLKDIALIDSLLLFVQGLWVLGKHCLHSSLRCGLTKMQLKLDEGYKQWESTLSWQSALVTCQVRTL